VQDILKPLVDKASSPKGERIAECDIVAWAGSLDNWSFYNSVSLALAREYLDDRLDYSLCDEVMNDLWQAVQSGLRFSHHEQVPQPFYDIYEAFDAGEYYRTANRHVDPAEQFTRPLIKKLLAEHPASEDISSPGLRAKSGASK
jgi:hypothetical protein